MLFREKAPSLGGLFFVDHVGCNFVYRSRFMRFVLSRCAPYAASFA
jgi:hypothetical protein